MGDVGGLVYFDSHAGGKAGAGTFGDVHAPVCVIGRGRAFLAAFILALGEGLAHKGHTLPTAVTAVVDVGVIPGNIVGCGTGGHSHGRTGGGQIDLRRLTARIMLDDIELLFVVDAGGVFQHSGV